jgi:tellurite resistance protein
MGPAPPTLRGRAPAPPPARRPPPEPETRDPGAERLLPAHVPPGASDAARGRISMMAGAGALSLAPAAAISGFHLARVALHPGVPLGHGALPSLFFSAGPMFRVVLLTLVVNRLMFHDPPPGRMAPTLMILLAPPAVACIARLGPIGEPAALGRILLSLGHVFALIVLAQPPRFRPMPFALSRWAPSFPLAALSVASFARAETARSAAHRLIGAGLPGLLAAVVAFLLARTAYAIASRGVCAPE